MWLLEQERRNILQKKQKYPWFKRTSMEEVMQGLSTTCKSFCQTRKTLSRYARHRGYC